MSTAATRVLSRSDGAAALALRSAKLVVIEGRDRGREASLGASVFRVGGAEDNDLVLSDDAVSRHHFEIAAHDDGFVLRDRGSTNATTISGLRVREAFLESGAEIACGRTRLRFEIASEEQEVPISRRTNFGALLGHGPAMRAAFAVLERAAKTEMTVLLLGESGTGKELAARALHDASPRKDGPYCVLDCGAAAPTLIESQLFGHARGAFTGADQARAGVFEEASGGTLVLDEIGELPAELQPKLLRAIEQRTICRLGEAQPRSVDVRFIACTHRNLEEEVRQGRFRQDLFFRLSVLSVRLPPLRERREEIGRLVRSFLAQLGAEREISESMIAALQSHDWPGNVRELRNVVERMVALSDLGPEHWMPRGASTAAAPPDASLAFHEAKQRCIDAFERSYFARLLELHGDNVSEAARVAGLSRQSCYRLMQKHGLRTAE
ncbi:MAG: sigma 54-dependent Fis family transcriptional regulator [Sandaracinaceae bacterium]|nr:sigma 54-dependent Fis family transcriptional regulator [Sandaracinaceae bacterium]